MTGQSNAPRLRLVPGGVSNSRQSLKSETPLSGIDTVRLRHRDPDGRFFEQLRGRPHVAGARGEVYVQANGQRWGAYPDGLAYVEGRVAALLDGPDAHYLATADQLVEAAELFADTIAADVAEVVVGRIDPAAELRFEDGREGLALMRGLAAADVPWLKTGTEGSKRDGLETVLWRDTKGRSIQYRLYDKGRESETAEPGCHLRGERQRRYRKGRELVAVEVPAVDLRSLYVGRELASFVEADLELTVCNSLDGIELLNALARAGQIKRGTADRLAGFVVSRHAQDTYTRPTWFRRWAALRQLGISLDEQAVELLRVPVSRHLGQLVDAWAVAA